MIPRPAHHRISTGQMSRGESRCPPIRVARRPAPQHQIGSTELKGPISRGLKSHKQIPRCDLLTTPLGTTAPVTEVPATDHRRPASRPTPFPPPSPHISFPVTLKPGGFQNELSFSFLLLLMWGHCQTREYERDMLRVRDGEGRVTRQKRSSPGKKGAAPLHRVRGARTIYAFTLPCTIFRIKLGQLGFFAQFPIVRRTRGRENGALPPKPCVGFPRRAATVGTSGPVTGPEEILQGGRPGPRPVSWWIALVKHTPLPFPQISDRFVQIPRVGGDPGPGTS